MRSLTVALAAAIALIATIAFALPAGACAQQIAKIQAGFHPYKLGAPTAVSLGFHIHAAGGGLPSPLTSLTFHYPRKLGLATAELGLAACEPQRLSLQGPKGCPPNSIMGHGSALAKFQVGPDVLAEQAQIGLVAGPSKHGYIQMLISATGSHPVASRIVMPTLLLPGRLAVSVPLVQGLPEGPDVAVVAVHVTLGGNLTYYARRHGFRIAYRPNGVTIPRRCPKGGFRFAATFRFLDGSSANASTVVHCPRPHRKRSKG